MSLVLKTAPATEPITTTEAKLYLRVDTSADDDLIAAMIVAARQKAEEYTLRSFITQTWTLWLDAFPYGRSERFWDGVVQASINTLNEGSRVINIPRPPVLTITHLKTYDNSDTATTFSSSNYIVDIAGAPGRIILKNGQSWPSALRPAQAIEIEYTAGYGAASAVPAAIKQALYLTIGYFYENRGACDGDLSVMGLPGMARVLLNPYRVLSIGTMNPQRTVL